MRVFEDRERRDHQDSRSQSSPTKCGPAKPAHPSGANRDRQRNDLSRSLRLYLYLRRRQSYRNHVSTIATARQVFGHPGALVSGKRLLGEGGEQIGIGMRIGAWLPFLQPLQHELGDVLHISF
jgi:hypothetical protein